LRTVINKIEKTLVFAFRPTFLSITHISDKKHPTLRVVISATSFNKKSVDQRIAQVFNALFLADKEVVEKNSIIVEAFTSSEMVDVFEYIK
jgi:hypothetical protein